MPKGLSKYKPDIPCNISTYKNISDFTEISIFHIQCGIKYTNQKIPLNGNVA